MLLLWTLLIVSAAIAPQRLPHVEAAPGRCFILARVDDPAPIVADAPECDRKTAPASTFKIPHALIALQTGVIAPDSVFKWDRTERDFESWERDHTLDSAMKSSVYPFFQHTAKLIGRERMREALAGLQYATDTFDGELTTFWTNGDLVVSPSEQVAFLQRMFAGKLSIAANHVDTVKRSLLMPPGRISNAAGIHEFALAWPPGTVVRAKTGNARVGGERISWLVGQLETNGVQYVFASRVRSAERSLASTAGAEAALAALNRLFTR